MRRAAQGVPTTLRAEGNLRQGFAQNSDPIVWHRFVSASASNDGYRSVTDIAYYQKLGIRGRMSFFQKSVNDEADPIPIGQENVERAMLYTQRSLGGTRDRIEFYGEEYRIESKSMPEPMGGLWATRVRLGLDSE